MGGQICYTRLTFFGETRQMEIPTIDERHRKELLGFLLVKTAAVRRGVKPAELLRVRHCYESVNSEGLRVCLYRSDIYDILRLDYIELKVEAESSLVLFYDPATLAKTLSDSRCNRWLARFGYPEAGETGTSLSAMLAHLVCRAAQCNLPHEVGVFIGYPLKDVVGFMRQIPATPVHHGAWRVYGGVRESLARMRIYKDAEDDARATFHRTEGISDFIDQISLKRVS